MNVRYVVTLTEAERSELQALVAKGNRLARRVKKAQILLAAAAVPRMTKSRAFS